MQREDLRCNQKYFDSLLDKASATALVLLHTDIVLANAGQISTAGLEIIKNAFAAHWSDNSSKLIYRYAGLLIDAYYHLLFIKPLSIYDLHLGLTFPLGTPLIRVRQDMTDILRVILIEPAILSKNSEVSEVMERSLQAGKQLITDSKLQWQGQPISPQWQEVSVDPVSEEKDEPLIELTASTEFDLLDNIELDVQQSEPFGAANNQNDVDSENLPWQSFNLMGQDIASALPVKPEQNNEKTDNRSSDLPDYWHPLPEVKAPINDLVSIFHDGRAFNKNNQPSVKKPPSKTNQDVDVGIDSVDDATQPIVFAGEENTKSVVSDFTFYLVPQDKHVFIVGDLAHHIRRLVPEICQTYGWTLGHLSVRPDYLKWRLIDFPESLLGDMLQVVRQFTADQIGQIGLAKDKNQEFWSPGYLVDPYNQDLSTQSLLMRFGNRQH